MPLIDPRDEPKTSTSIHKPPPRPRTPPPMSAAARDQRDRIALQGDQDPERFVTQADLARARETQDWTAYHNGLIRMASRNAALEGGSSADQRAIEQMLLPHDQQDLDPGYVPSPEALQMITEQDALIAAAKEAAEAAEANPDDKDAALRAREADLDAREAVVKAQEVASREAAIAAREKALERREAPAKIESEDDLRDFRPSVSAPNLTGVTWGADTVGGPGMGRKRMTPEERERAELEGMEMFGIDPTANSAWSKVKDVAGQPRGPRHSHNTGRQDEADRINLQARQAALRDAQQRRLDAVASGDPQSIAEAYADELVAEGETEDQAYDRRQREAKEQVEAFLRGDRRHL